MLFTEDIIHAGPGVGKLLYLYWHIRVRIYGTLPPYFLENSWLMVIYSLDE